LGYMYEFGLGVDRDLHLAKRYYDRAYEYEPKAYLPSTLASLKVLLKIAWNRSWLDALKSQVLHVQSYLSELSDRMSTLAQTQTRSSSSPTMKPRRIRMTWKSYMKSLLLSYKWAWSYFQQFIMYLFVFLSFLYYVRALFQLLRQPGGPRNNNNQGEAGNHGEEIRNPAAPLPNPQGQRGGAEGEEGQQEQGERSRMEPAVRPNDNDTDINLGLLSRLEHSDERIQGREEDQLASQRQSRPSLQVPTSPLRQSSYSPDQPISSSANASPSPSIPSPPIKPRTIPYRSFLEKFDRPSSTAATSSSTIAGTSESSRLGATTAAAARFHDSLSNTKRQKQEACRENAAAEVDNDGDEIAQKLD
jgi:hypothetical protein